MAGEPAPETTGLDVDGLKRLAQEPFFESWEGEEPPAILAAARDIMRRTVHKLIELGPVAPVPDALGVLQGCIEAFNELDVVDGAPWIGTIQREDISEEFYRVADLTGLQDRPELEDGTEWRDY